MGLSITARSGSPAEREGAEQVDSEPALNGAVGLRLTARSWGRRQFQVRGKVGTLYLRRLSGGVALG